MPLFMDFHKINNVTVEDVKAAHVADVAIQHEYGVKYHQFWVNLEAGTVFCLMEGPDAATCEKVHQLAHGNIACAMTEVEPGFYEKMMGKNQYVDHGHVQKTDGSEDSGYRTILLIAITGITRATSSKELMEIQQPAWARKIVADQIDAFGGRWLPWETDDSIIGIFDDSVKAVHCARQTQEMLLATPNNSPSVIFRMSLSAAQPVTAEGDFFRCAIQLAHRLCMAAQKNEIVTSSLVKKLSGLETLSENKASLRWFNEKEEDFISHIIQVAELKMSDEKFGLDKLCSEVCVSRPQLYRKLMSLTGRSPNDFVRDMRMEKAVSMLKQQKANITEVAYETGFKSPSYFSKCFADKFGCTPSEFVKKTALLH